jgi:hypothetical protein
MGPLVGLSNCWIKWRIGPVPLGLCTSGFLVSTRHSSTMWQRQRRRLLSRNGGKTTIHSTMRRVGGTEDVLSWIAQSSEHMAPNGMAWYGLDLIPYHTVLFQPNTVPYHTIPWGHMIDLTIVESQNHFCNSWRARGQQEGLQYNGEAAG